MSKSIGSAHGESWGFTLTGALPTSISGHIAHGNRCSCSRTMGAHSDIQSLGRKVIHFSGRFHFLHFMHIFIVTLYCLEIVLFQTWKQLIHFHPSPPQYFIQFVTQCLEIAELDGMLPTDQYVDIMLITTGAHPLVQGSYPFGLNKFHTFSILFPN